MVFNKGKLFDIVPGLNYGLGLTGRKAFKKIILEIVEFIRKRRVA